MKKQHCAVVQTNDWGTTWFLYYWACDYEPKFEPHEHPFPMKLVAYIPHGGVTAFCACSIIELDEPVIFQSEEELVKWVAGKTLPGYQYDRYYAFLEEV